jgi:hypothetical protein
MYNIKRLLPRLDNYRLEIIEDSYHVINNVTEVSEYENRMLPQAFSVLYQLEAGLDAMIDQSDSGELQSSIEEDLLEIKSLKMSLRCKKKHSML